MNYEKIYYAITNRAKEEAKIGIRCKSTEAYFEKHHIVPRSLNGTNSPDNIALLTAREHFLCHAILVRIYKSGTVEHNKMLFAFWRMKADPQGKSRRYINSRLYEKYRNEYSKLVSTNQSGKLNSNYGNRWYTNLNTGESNLFNICPSEEWILGRNKLRKAFNFITHEERFLVYPFEKPWVKYEDKDKYQICFEDGKIDKNLKINLRKTSNSNIDKIRKLLFDSDIDFSEVGWLRKAAKRFGIKRKMISRVIARLSDDERSIFKMRKSPSQNSG